MDPWGVEGSATWKQKHGMVQSLYIMVNFVQNIHNIKHHIGLPSGQDKGVPFVNLNLMFPLHHNHIQGSV